MPVTKAYLRHDQIMAGGELRFVMQSTPNKAGRLSLRIGHIRAVSHNDPLAVVRDIPTTFRNRTLVQASVGGWNWAVCGLSASGYQVKKADNLQWKSAGHGLRGGKAGNGTFARPRSSRQRAVAPTRPFG